MPRAAYNRANGQPAVGGKEMDVEHKDLTRMLGEAHSAGTEAFRDALLARCLDVLDEDERSDDLTDGDLDLLAAAGNPAGPMPVEWAPMRTE